MRVAVIGGHLTPALAVIELLKEEEVIYIGRKHSLEGDKALSLEYQAITSLGIPFKSIITGRLQRKFTRYTILSLLKIPVGFVQALFILRRLKPHVVLGFGSYVQIPVIFAALLMRVPVVVHEQTLEAGLANKTVSFFATKICVSWENSQKFFPQKKTVLTGNPIRREIIEIFDNSVKETGDGPLIYITGGSQGSHSINIMVEKVIKRLLPNARVIHQTGDAQEYQDFERLSYLRDSLPDDMKKRYLPQRFLETKEVAQVLKNADLVIGRSGVNTITELIFLSKPSLLIPLPLGKEQKKNALFLSELGLAEVRLEEGLTPDEFLNTLRYMFENYSKYSLNKDYKIYIRDAASKIVNVLRDVWSQNNKVAQ
jgi:UDP-N-acetylglucosamine--N-acetylmuramyl-(pentapeptide) pyrophosphoryl-undecaprenol N-acetylglucosamine transferase